SSKREPQDWGNNRNSLNGPAIRFRSLRLASSSRPRDSPCHTYPRLFYFRVYRREASYSSDSRPVYESRVSRALPVNVAAPQLSPLVLSPRFRPPSHLPPPPPSPTPRPHPPPPAPPPLPLPPPSPAFIRDPALRYSLR